MLAVVAVPGYAADVQVGPNLSSSVVDAVVLGAEMCGMRVETCLAGVAKVPVGIGAWLRWVLAEILKVLLV